MYVRVFFRIKIISNFSQKPYSLPFYLYFSKAKAINRNFKISKMLLQILEFFLFQNKKQNRKKHVK